MLLSWVRLLLLLLSLALSLPSPNERVLHFAYCGIKRWAVVTGSTSESTRDSLSTLAAPTGPFESTLSTLASRWKALKASLHADVPAAFDPRARCG